MTQLPFVEGTQNRALSQWFTPAQLARRIADWALEPLATRACVLEPSAGRGALALAIRSASRAVAIDSPFCVEIDPGNAAALGRLGFEVHCGDFLTLQPDAPGPFGFPRFDIAIMNPPYEGGQTERHIMHALKLADRVVCHCPLTTLAGKGRGEKLWSTVDLHRLAICSTRPKYGDKAGATDMCTIDVTLAPKYAQTQPANVKVEWWP